MISTLKKLAQFSLMVIACASASLAQNVTGKVVDVLDGRTLVMETSAGRMTVQLQYVEVPENGQPLFAIVRDHLSKLAVGKSVEHKSRRIVNGNSTNK